MNPAFLVYLGLAAAAATLLAVHAGAAPTLAAGTAALGVLLALLAAWAPTPSTMPDPAKALHPLGAWVKLGALGLYVAACLVLTLGGPWAPLVLVWWAP